MSSNTSPLVTSSSSSSRSGVQLLKIRPKELVYNPPFQGFKTNVLKLNNISEHILAYKVKTTAPIRYCVRPNTGIIPPGESIDVQILLNCTKDMPSISMKTKDKFQIQSTIVSELNADPKLIWSNTPQSQIVKQRLRAVFALQPSSNDQQNHNGSSVVVVGNDDLSNISSISNKSLSAIKEDSESEDEKKDNYSDTSNFNSTILHTAPNHTNIEPTTTTTTQDDTLQIRKRIVTPLSTNNVSNTNPNNNLSTTATSASSNNDQDYFSKENIQLTNQVKFMKDKIEQLESQIQQPSNQQQSSSSTTSRNGSSNFSQVQTLIIIFIIALLSFYFGRLI